MARITDVSLWIDGACSTQLRAGGWASLIVVKTMNGDVRKMDSGAIRDTTSNQMEVIALEQGLLNLKYGCNVKVHTDSANLIGWMSQGWKRKNGTIALFLDRIENMCKEQGHTLSFVKVEGHTGEVGNEMVNAEAQRQREIAKALPS